MTPRNLALAALKDHGQGPGSVERYLDRAFVQAPHLNERDRAFTVHLVQGVLRWRLRLDYIIRQSVRFPFRKIEPAILDILRIALYQIFYMERVPESAAVNEAVKQAKAMGQGHLVGFVNGILRQICRQKDRITFPDKCDDLIGHLSVKYSFPAWLVKKWTGELGPDSAQRLLDACNRIPGLVIRANKLRIDRQGLIGRLEMEGVTGVPTGYVPDGIEVKGLKGQVNRLNAFREGLFQVQGEASQACSYLISPKTGESLLDLCAGLGGKTTHMAEIMGDRGSILALDMSLRRLVSLAQTSRRLGIHCISPVVADAVGRVSSLIRRRFDRIIVDPPCSALGTISRHPDGKWTRDECDVNRLALLQGKILDQALPLLRSGGRMLYTTCTISREENEAVIEGFLKRNKGTALVDLTQHVPAWGGDLIDENGIFRAFPHVHGMDGFFGALLEKKND